MSFKCIFLSPEVLLGRWRKRFGVQHSGHNWNFRTWGFHIVCSRTWRPVAKHIQLICGLVVWMSLWWDLKSWGFFPILILETTLKSVSHRHLQWPLCAFQALQLAVGWSNHTAKPQSQWILPKGRVWRLPDCGLCLWLRSTQRAFVQEGFHLSHWVLHSFIPPLHHTCLVVIVYSGTKSPTPAVPSQSLHRREFFPPDPGGTAVRTCWWHSHNSALSWMKPGLRELTPDLELLRFSLVRSQNCFQPRQIYTVWCHLTAPASECKWHKEHVEQMEWDMHVKNWSICEGIWQGCWNASSTVYGGGGRETRMSCGGLYAGDPFPSETICDLFL